MSHHNGLIAAGLVAAVAGTAFLAVPEWTKAVKSITEPHEIAAAPQTPDPGYTWLGNKPAPSAKPASKPATQPAMKSAGSGTIIMHSKPATRPSVSMSGSRAVVTVHASPLDKDIVPPTALGAPLPSTSGNNYAVTGVVRSAARVYTAPSYGGASSYSVVAGRPMFHNTFNNALGGRLGSLFENINQSASNRTANSFMGGPAIASESSNLAQRLNGVFGSSYAGNQNDQNWNW